MKTIRTTIYAVLGALLTASMGCVGYVDAPGPEASVAVYDDYVYYPAYQVYYGRNHHHYIYRDGRHWVTRPGPRVSVDALVASPSVQLQIHDSPWRNHSQVVRQYPKRWAPDRHDRH